MLHGILFHNLNEVEEICGLLKGVKNTSFYQNKGKKIQIEVYLSPRAGHSTKQAKKVKKWSMGKKIYLRGLNPKEGVEAMTKALIWNIRSVKSQKAFQSFHMLNRLKKIAFIALIEPFQQPYYINKYKGRL